MDTTSTAAGAPRELLLRPHPEKTGLNFIVNFRLLRPVQAWINGQLPSKKIK